MVHDGVVATTQRTLSGAGAGAPPTLSSVLAFTSFPPRSVQQVSHALRRRSWPAVGQVWQHARANNVRGCVPSEFECLEDVMMSSARTSVGTSVAGGAGGWESTRTTTGVSEWVGPAHGPWTTNVLDLR